MTPGDRTSSPDDPTLVLVDVTNTLDSDRITGIQRVTRELTAELSAHPAISLVLLRHCSGCRSLRPLTASEHAGLRSEPTPATRRIDRLPAPLNALARAAIAVRPIRRLVADAGRRRADGAHGAVTCAHPTLFDLAVPGSFFIDIEAAWWNPEPRADLLPELADAGVRCGMLAHDVLPLSNPEWFDEGSLRAFRPWIDAHFRVDSLVIANSAFTLDAVRAQRERMNTGWHGTEGVIAFGAELPGEPASSESRPPAGLRPRPYLLMVSTIEPRKNHRLALDLIAALESRPALELVIVGKPGWNSRSTIRAINHAERNGGRVDWITTASDADLADLYRGATLTLVPSLAEGFGLSVIESIAYGTPVLASTAAALREAGGDLVDFADPHDLRAWIRSVEDLTAPDGHRSPAADARAAALRTWTPPTWKAAADQFATLVTAARRRGEN